MASTEKVIVQPNEFGMIQHARNDADLTKSDGFEDKDRRGISMLLSVKAD